MRCTIDTGTALITTDAGAVPLYSREGFELLSELWLKVGWDQKYVYTFSWLGRPVIQLPEDLVRVQEVLHRVRPDVIVETGVAHGGSLVFYASLCKAMDKGRVVGVDIEIRPHNRTAIEQHPLSGYITLIEGSSTDQEVLGRVADEIGPEDTVLVMLDSAHGRAHVRAELEAYCGFVTPGSYIVAADGIMDLVADVPRGNPAWKQDNPVCAVHDFLTGHPEFVVEQPPWPFDESGLNRNVTHWPDAYLRRVS
jgi:cephalosporin hydroxylase